MAISFFKGKNEGYYASIEKTTRDEATYQWIFDRGIELGRMSSFEIEEESPIFDTFVEAEEWIRANWGSSVNWSLHDDEASVDDDTLYEPNQENYTRCAQVAVEYNEFFASSELKAILEREKNHVYCCSVGVWYWEIGHKWLASMAYERSLEIHPEAATYFNLAVCRDDLEQTDLAQAAIKKFYETIKDDKEKMIAEQQLKDHGKAHLIQKQT